MTIRVAVLGASGRMGQRVTAEVLADPDCALVALVDSPRSPTLGQKVGDISIGVLDSGVFDSADVVIDFSEPTALEAALPYLASAALVTGTTGLALEQQRALEASGADRAVLQAANFSTGVNVLLDLVRRAARTLGDYDIEVIEAHHRNKVDAPSGTALALGRAAAAGRQRSLDELAVHGRRGLTGVRPAGEIGFHALRGGDVAGDHTVWIAGSGERIELRHVASSRATFAKGAVRAAKWLAGRPAGAYNMSDVLNLD